MDIVEKEKFLQEDEGNIFCGKILHKSLYKDILE